MHLADHCNLNCVHCSHYSPLAEPKFVDAGQYESDFKRLAELGADKLELIRLMGGEPLLNSNAASLAGIARKYFPECKIQIVTNGVLLLKQDEIFWRECGKNNIEIFISYYPVSLDYNAINGAAKKYKIKLSFGKDDRIKTREMGKFELDLDGKQDFEKSFRKCGAANGCANLREGKIYPCPTSAHIGIFNKRFGRNLELSEKDSVDIYRAESMDEIFEFLRKPVPFCRYCTNKGGTTQWRASKKEITEWAAAENSAPYK
jgi:MoaA/NifB/PqqE/SkfB family radical SAM enzyme